MSVSRRAIGAVLWLCTTNTTNGAPRRAAAVISRAGNVLAWREENYSGESVTVRAAMGIDESDTYRWGAGIAYPHTVRVNVSPSEWRAWRKRYNGLAPEWVDTWSDGYGEAWNV